MTHSHSTLRKGLAALAMFAAGTAQAQAILAGTALYRERMALPPDATLEVTLEDVSRADAPATLLGQVRVDNPGNPPIRFGVPYDPAQVNARHTYAARARIVQGGKLLFTTDTRHAVSADALLHGEPRIDLSLVKVQAAPGTAAATPAPGTPLVNTYWKLVRLGEQPIKRPAAPNQREAHLVLHTEGQRVAGSDGCNRIMGSFQLDGVRLSFGQLAGTKMACLDGMEQADAFTRALAQVAAWRVDGAVLTLGDASGQLLARFEAVALP